MSTTEAKVTVNGIELTEAQSMTLRVALESFALDVQGDGLGKDAHGRKMAALYRDRIREIREAMYPLQGLRRAAKDGA